MKKIFFVLITAFVLASVGVFTSKAQAETSADIQAKVDLVNKLTTQINELQSQITSLMKEIKTKQAEQGAEIAELIRSLRQGTSGDDVQILQAILAADSSIYPEGVLDGKFGRATARAVAKFQEKYGLGADGVVGPKTLKKLNEILNEIPLATKEDESGNKQLCATVPPGHLIAPGWLKKNNGVRPIVPECQTLPAGIAKKIDGTFYPPSSDKTAPVISAVAASGIGSASVKITWTTDENSTSKVYYSKTTPIDTSTALSVTNNSLVKSHSMSLTALSPSTVYYFMVESKDSSKNTTQSSQSQFTTAAPDTTAPVISNVGTSNVTATAAKVSWTTNENSTSKVYYSTSTPVNLGTAMVVSNTELVSSHNLNVTGLNSDTTYYFVVESKDDSNNKAVATESNFKTMAVDTVAPVISAIASSSITIDGATITWTTNEPSTTKVYYGTTTPLALGTAKSVKNDTLTTSHSIDLDDLTVNTKYYFVVESKDGSNNTAQSSEQTFTTLADTTAPAISGISISALTSTSATINWHTSEKATSKVYYSTSTPLDVNTALSVSSSSLVEDHSLSVTSLTANTTYYFVIESSDSSNNKTATTEQYFVTLL